MHYLVILFIALAISIGAQVHDVMQQGRTVTQSAQRTQSSALLTQAAAAIAAAASDSDGDGIPEAAAFLAATPAPISGGQIATASDAPKVDAWGTAFGYCSWDNGSINSSTNRITGDQYAFQSSVVFAVISAGPDKTFNTTCAQAKAGTAQGDDGIRVMTVGQLNKGAGGTPYWGDPVATPAALAALNTTALKAGATRLVQSTNTHWTWSGTTWLASQVIATGTGLVSPNPTPANSSSNPVVAVGYSTTAIIDSLGDVYVAGLQGTYQEWGQALAQQLSWTKLTTISGATGIWMTAQGANGDNYNALWVRKTDGSVWVAGGNYAGSLGVGSTSSQPTFVQSLSASGNTRTVLPRSTGSAYYFDATNQALFRTGDFSSAGNYAYNGGAATTIWTYERSSNLSAAYAGDCVAAVYASGQLYLEGGASSSDNTYCSASASTGGGLGGGWKASVTGVSSVAVGCAPAYYCWQYVIKTDGTLWSKGYNSIGQLGVGDNSPRTTFTQATALGTTAKKMLTSSTNSSGLACGYVIDSAGYLWATGANSFYNFGDGSTTPRYTFSKITDSNIKNVVGVYEYSCRKTIVAKSDGTLWVTGVNNNGQYGLGTGTATYTTWTRIL